MGISENYEFHNIRLCGTWNILFEAERGEREARSTHLTNASLQQTSGLTRPAGLVLVGSFQGRRPFFQTDFPP